MSDETAVIEVAEPHSGAPQEIGGDARPQFNALDTWIESHFEAIALWLLACGFALRIFATFGTYLNPDEALHALIARQPTAWLSYQASLTNAHPPLIFLVLHFWQLLGHAEWYLRLPSVLAGTAFCWALFRWAGILFDRRTALAALILGAFNPALIQLSAQVRGYALLLCCLGGALYYLERGLDRSSARDVGFFALFLYLAILSHYSAMFCVFALGVYALARIAAGHPPRQLIAAWAASQLGAIAIYAFLYFTHISKIQKAEMDTWSAPHGASMFHAGQGSLFGFTLKQTLTFFRYFFPENSLYQGLLVVFIAGVVLLIARRNLLGTTRASWPVALLILLPFATNWAASLANIYPYEGSRQNVFVAPFVIAGIAVLLVAVYGRKPWALYLIAILLAVAAQSSGAVYDPLLKNGNQNENLMTGAMTFVRQVIPQSDPIFVDMQSGFVLTYYLCNSNDRLTVARFGTDFTPYSCGGYTVVRDEQKWKHTPGNFVDRFREMAATYRLQPGQRVWVFQAGWFANLDTELSWFVIKYRCLTSTSFGDDITVIPLYVGPDLSPELPPGSPHLSRLGRCVNDPPAPNSDSASHE